MQKLGLYRILEPAAYGDYKSSVLLIELKKTFPSKLDFGSLTHQFAVTAMLANYVWLPFCNLLRLLSSRHAFSRSEDLKSIIKILGKRC